MQNKVIGWLIALVLAFAPVAAFAQANVQPVIVNGTSSGGGNLTCPVGSVSGNSCPMPVTVQGSSSGGVAHAQTAALAANLVVKASAGDLYSFEVAADSTLSGAAWWVMIYDATTAPSDGSITPAKCYALPSGATSITGAFPTPVAFINGIVIGVSTTGCFMKTASIHAFIGGDYQ